MKSTVKADFVMPIVVLLLICLVMSGLLAGTNFITEPIIAEGNLARAEQARIDVLPAADGFQLMDVSIPEGNTVTEVYEATNGAGYVFMISTTGYGAKGSLQLICSIDAEGKIVDTNTLSHGETAGLGTKVTEDGFRSQFPGKDASLEGVDAIGGATISSSAYIRAIEDVFAVYSSITK
ncbi:MAG: FMN-binding protein [Ruminococcaceae bacterium]|nr:FMN-binding protein [Oscillospiraceae bacterium]